VAPLLQLKAAEVFPSKVGKSTNKGETIPREGGQPHNPPSTLGLLFTMARWKAEFTNHALIILIAALIIPCMEICVYICIHIDFPYFFFIHICTESRCLIKHSLSALQATHLPGVEVPGGTR